MGHQGSAGGKWGLMGHVLLLNDSLVNWLQLLHVVTVELELQGASLKGFVVRLCCFFIVSF